jgi:hypothetical protein
MSQWEIPKPQPVMSEETAPFWEGTAKGELRVQRCAACGSLQLPASAVCSSCLSSDIAWIQVSGHGTVFSFTVVHHAFHPAFASEVPYVVADIELDEGPVLTASIVDVDHAEVKIGMEVEARFRRLDEEYVLCVFTPRGSELPEGAPGDSGIESKQTGGK